MSSRWRSCAGSVRRGCSVSGWPRSLRCSPSPRRSGSSARCSSTGGSSPSYPCRTRAPPSMPPTLLAGLPPGLAGRSPPPPSRSVGSSPHPVLDQLKRSGGTRAALARSVGVDAAAVAVAAVGVYLLRRGDDDPVALVTPGLLALGAGLLAVRLLPLAARAAVRRTSASARVASFLAFRNVARRPGGAPARRPADRGHHARRLRRDHVDHLEGRALRPRSGRGGRGDGPAPGPPAARAAARAGAASGPGRPVGHGRGAAAPGGRDTGPRGRHHPARGGDQLGPGVGPHQHGGAHAGPAATRAAATGGARPPRGVGDLTPHGRQPARAPRRSSGAAGRRADRGGRSAD